MTVGDAALLEVVGADLDGDAVSEHNLDAEAPELAREVGLNGHGVAVGIGLSLDEELPAGVHINHLAFERDQIIAGQAILLKARRVTGWPSDDKAVKMGQQHQLLSAVTGLLALMTACGSPTNKPGGSATTRDTDTAEAPLDLPPGAVVLDGVRVVDAAGVQEQVAVVLVSDTIHDVVAMGSPYPDHATVHDLTGHTVLPGLIDAHVHLFLDGMVLPEGDHLLDNLRANLAWGVVGVGDFGAPTAIFDLRDRIQRGSVAGPRIWSTGPFITVPGAHPCESYNDAQQCRFIETTGDGADHVHGELAPSDGIKLAIADAAFTPWPTPLIDIADIIDTTDAAHADAKLVVAHVDTPEDIADALGNGVDILGHPAFDAPGAAPVDAPVTSTLGAFTGTLALLDGTLVEDDLSYTPAVARTEWEAITEFPVAWLSNAWRTSSRDWADAAKANLTASIAAGQVVVAGSDAGYLFVPHGLALHRELEGLVDLGMQPVDAIAAATSVPASLFGWDDLGFVAPGYRAHLLVVAGDPSTDIRSTRNIHSVWLDGAPIDVDGDLLPTLADGTTCLTESDCPAGTGCDRLAHTCVPTCDEAYDRVSCDPDSACLPADGVDGPPVCVELQTCELLAQDCSPEWYGEACVPVDLDTNRCWPVGPQAPGEECSWSDPDLFCIKGSYCSWVDNTCYRLCDPDNPDDPEVCPTCTTLFLDGQSWFSICLD